MSVLHKLSLGVVEIAISAICLRYASACGGPLPGFDLDVKINLRWSERQDTSDPVITI